MKKKREYNRSEEFNRSYAYPVEISIGKTVSQSLSSESALKERLSLIVRDISRASGISIPQINITENEAPNSYSINLFNVQVGKGKIYPGLYIIRDYHEKLKSLLGNKGFDPIWGPPYPCLWIHEKDIARAKSLGFQALNGEELIIHHLAFILSVYQGEFLDPQEFEEILLQIESAHPELMKKVTAKTESPVLYRIVKSLISEGISLNHLSTILNIISKLDTFEKEEIRAVEQLRKLLKYEICNTVAPEKILHCIVLSIPLQIYYALKSSNFHRKNIWAHYLIKELKKIQRKAASREYTPVLLCIPEIRPLIFALTRNFLPSMHILKTSEIPQDYEVTIVDIIEPPLWKIIPSLILPYVTASLTVLGTIWKSTDTYMELIDKSEDEFIMGKLSPSIQGRAGNEPSAISDDPSKTLQGAPSVMSGDLTPGQKSAIFLLGSPPWYVKDVLSRLEPKDINSLGKEMARLAKYSHNYREQILKEFPELDHKCCDAEEAAKFVRASLNGEYYKPQTAPIQKLALLLTSLSGKTGEMVTSAILSRLQKNKLENLIIEINTLKFAATVELKAQIIEEFVVFYKSFRSPQTLFTPQFYYREIQRASLCHPKEFAHTLQTLWLNSESIINRFNRWANQDPTCAAFWINRFYACSAQTQSDFRLLEKASYIMYSISTELSAGIFRNLKSFSRLLLPPKKLSYMNVNQSQQEEILRQFLSHYYSLYHQKTGDNMHGDN